MGDTRRGKKGKRSAGDNWNSKPDKH